MNLPEGMSHARRESPVAELAGVLPRMLLPVLTLLVLLGISGTLAAVYTARTTTYASRADVQRNRDLIARVAALEEQGNRDAAEHRLRNEELHADLCRLVYAAISASPQLRTQAIEPCRPPIIPTVGAGPSPSPSAR